jgi:hypothetical protein
MGLNISYNQNFDGIDTAEVGNVTREIFKRAAAQSSTPSNVTTNFDFSKFKKQDLGLDLYKTDAETAKQIAMTNAGLNVKLSANAVSSLAYLNNVASKASVKVVDAQNAPVVKEETVSEKKVLQFPKLNSLLKTVNTGRDKNGSNPFAQNLVARTAKKKAEQEDAIDLIA